MPFIQSKGWDRALKDFNLILAATLAAGLLTACEIPEAPEWDVGVVAPFTSDRISIIDFLPDEVDTATVEGQAAFAVAAQSDSTGYSLGQMCASCQVLNGLTVQVPSFDYVDSLDVFFPSKLFGIEIQRAGLSLQVRNDLNFDPLRPNPNPVLAGFISLSVRDLGTGAGVDSVVVRGDTMSLPSGSTTQLDLALASGIELFQGIRIIYRIHSPQDGQTVQIDTSMAASLKGALVRIAVSAVTVVVDQEVVDEQFTVDVDEDLRAQLQGRVQGGEFEFVLEHDVEVEGDLEISIAGSPASLFSANPTEEIRLGPLTLTSGASHGGQLTAEQFELLAGFPEVHMGYLGTAAGTRVSLGRDRLSRFTPGQSLLTRFQLTSRLRIGG